MRIELFSRKRVTRREDKAERPKVQCRDGSLVIDCRGCPGVQDLADPGCMRCLLRSLATSPSVETLVLSRNLDVAYEGTCVTALLELAEAVRLCQVPPQTPERACQSCASRPSLVLAKLADSIPYGWNGVAITVSPLQPRARCHSCAAQVNDAASAVVAKLRNVERMVSREAFMVVGESGHA